jgi:hypothetical protein
MLGIPKRSSASWSARIAIAVLGVVTLLPLQQISWANSAATISTPRRSATNPFAAKSSSPKALKKSTKKQATKATKKSAAKSSATTTTTIAPAEPQPDVSLVFFPSPIPTAARFESVGLQDRDAKKTVTQFNRTSATNVLYLEIAASRTSANVATTTSAPSAAGASASTTSVSTSTTSTTSATTAASGSAGSERIGNRDVNITPTSSGSDSGWIATWTETDGTFVIATIYEADRKTALDTFATVQRVDGTTAALHIKASDASYRSRKGPESEELPLYSESSVNENWRLSVFVPPEYPLGEIERRDLCWQFAANGKKADPYCSVNIRTTALELNKDSLIVALTGLPAIETSAKPSKIPLPVYAVTVKDGVGVVVKVTGERTNVYSIRTTFLTAKVPKNTCWISLESGGAALAKAPFGFTQSPTDSSSDCATISQGK